MDDAGSIWAVIIAIIVIVNFYRQNIGSGKP